MDEAKSPAAELIVSLGGPHAIARKLNVNEGAARAWKVRNHIPRKVWPDLLEAYPQLTLDALRAVETGG